MKRWYLAAVAGLWSFAPLSAQNGALAPTAPMVPAPVLQGGNLGAPGGLGADTGGRSFSLTKWTPFRSPATASATEPTAPSAAAYGQPLPAGVIGAAGACGAGGCGPSGGQSGRDRSRWAHLKAFMCYHPSDTELPRHRPTPYVTPLQGMFACSTVGGGCAGCTSGCAPGSAQPQIQPTMMYPPQGAGPVGVMPPRGAQGGASQTVWQTRPAPAPTTPGIAGYRYATVPTPGPVVNTSLQQPAQK